MSPTTICNVPRVALLRKRLKIGANDWSYRRCGEWSCEWVELETDQRHSVTKDQDMNQLQESLLQQYTQVHIKISLNSEM